MSDIRLPTLLCELPTPCLLLDEKKLAANAQRMSQHITGLGCQLRPHVKTAKSIDVINTVIATGGTAGITVSTLQEAEYFFENGISDILYGVGIAPNKLTRVAELMNRGCDIKLVLDSPQMARLVAEAGAKLGVVFRVLIELDVDGHRSGALPDAEETIEIGRILSDSVGSELLGVMTHAGESYNCLTPESQRAMAAQEREGALLAANRLRDAGLDCPVVSIGSTPTALATDNLEGITEVRAGVYLFMDLTMAGLGLCTPDDIAISVLCSVIGHQPEKDWVITDAGWMALSSDTGDGKMAEHGYGLVRDIEGVEAGTFTVQQLNQEHGIVEGGDGSQSATEVFPIGAMLRVLPNHACATSSQHNGYFLVQEGRAETFWNRTNHW